MPYLEYESLWKKSPVCAMRFLAWGFWFLSCIKNIIKEFSNDDAMNYSLFGDAP
jgi:hypothetical protein